MTPTDVKLHQASRVLEVVFPDGRQFRLPYEFLRVHSPSAEVRGHGPGQEVLQVGKRHVTITEVEPDEERRLFVRSPWPWVSVPQLIGLLGPWVWPSGWGADKTEPSPADAREALTWPEDRGLARLASRRTDRGETLD